MFITLTEVTSLAPDCKVTVLAEHIVYVSESPGGLNGSKNNQAKSFVHLSSGIGLHVKQTREEVILLIEQCFAAERAAYTVQMEVDEDLGWPVYKHWSKDPN